MTPQELELIPANVTVEQDGKQIPLRETPYVTESPDYPTLLKRGYDSHRAIGGMVRVPAKDAKPEEVQAFRKKVGEAGVHIPKPYPESPDKYEVKKPEGLNPEIPLDEETIGAVRKVAHELELPQEALDKILPIHFAYVEKVFKAYKKSKEEAIKKFDAALIAKGENPEKAKAAIGRYIAKKFGDADYAVFNTSGYGNHPAFLQMAYENALANGEDLADIRPEEDKTADAEYQETRKIMMDPKHPDHEKWKAEGSDGPLHQRIRDAYKKRWGTAETNNA